MNILADAYTDIGIKRSTNQDSLCVKVADSEIGTIVMGIVCDGMGGLAKGEVASATVLQRFCTWFEDELPGLLEQKNINAVENSIRRIIQTENEKILSYGNENHIQLGTTLTLMLIIGQGQLLIAHVGDSRAYKISDRVAVLTEDQTVVSREVRSGRLTKEQAKVDPRRNVLLQCIGASKIVEPDIQYFVPERNCVYMMCSDGFRHVISEDEIYEYLNPSVLISEQKMRDHAVKLVELNKSRNETDNISVLLVKLN